MRDLSPLADGYRFPDDIVALTVRWSRWFRLPSAHGADGHSAALPVGLRGSPA